VNDSTLINLCNEKPLGHLDRYVFEIVPTTGRFDAMLIEVPTTQGVEAAARRAYFSAMAMLAARGLDIDDFAVNEWVGSDERGHPGRAVGPGGFTS
jgi:hypothetical protein